MVFWSQDKFQVNSLKWQEGIVLLFLISNSHCHNLGPSYLDASHGSHRRSLNVNETSEHNSAAVEASRRQQAGASCRPQHRHRKWTEAANAFLFFLFILGRGSQHLSDSSGLSTWARPPPHPPYIFYFMKSTDSCLRILWWKKRLIQHIYSSKSMKVTNCLGNPFSIPAFSCTHPCRAVGGEGGGCFWNVL